MLKNRLICTLLMTFLCSGFVAAQGVSITGVVTDPSNEPLISASVQLKNAGDTIVAGTLTDVSGAFSLSRITAGSYIIEVAYLGYKPFVKQITIRAEPVALGTIRLVTGETTNLAEVKVVAQAIAVRQKTDTTEYNAGSYKVNPDANAADLIRKMPGMDLSSGAPKTQGEAIVKVLVDGKPFFGTDPTTALNNLPAEVIDKIQVYDEKSEQEKFTGFDDGTTSKTINIVTKPEKRQGIFGQVHAGYWPDNKYNLGGNVNYFSEKRRISLIGLSNNVNIQNFGAQDLIGVGGGGRRRHHRGRDNNFMVDPSEGIAKTNAVGINYTDLWGKKMEVTGSYFFNNSHNTANQETYRTYISSGQQGQTYEEQTRSVTDNYNHRFNMRMDYTIDSNNSILFMPRLSIQSNDRYSDLSGSTLRDGLDVLNKTLNHQARNQTAYDFSSRLLIRHKFRKPGRTLSFWGRVGWSEQSGSSRLEAENTYEDTTQNGFVAQRTTGFENEWDLDANITYTEPLSKNSGLQFRYRLSYDAGRSDERAYDLSSQGGQPIPDSLLSNTFSSQYLTHRPGLGYRHSDEKLHLGLRLYYQYATLRNEGILPYSFTQTKQFENILPSVWMRYQFDKNKSLRLYYRAGTDNPSVRDLQAVVDNRNPLQLSSGNPMLDQAHEQRLRVRYSGTNPETSTTFFSMFGVEATQGYIGKSTLIADQDMELPNGIFLPEGAQYTRPENMDGYWEIEGYSSYGMPLSFLKSNLNLNARAAYERTPGAINGEKNFANNYNTGLGFTLSSNISEKIDFTIGSAGSYNWVKNTLNKSADNSFYNQTSRFSVNLIFWKGLVWNTELDHQLYTGLDQSFNQNFLLWNMSIGKKLFKKQRGEIKLTVFDLLNQNNDLQRTVTALYTEDVQTNVLQRYFLLTFVYNLRFFQGGASMKDIDH